MIHWRREWQTTPVYLLWEPHGPYKRLERYDTKRWVPQVWRCPVLLGKRGGIPSSPRVKEAAGPKWIGRSVVGVSRDESKIWCCKEQYCIRTWNVTTMNQEKLDMVKQEITRINIKILGIRELKWTGMGEFNSGNHYICYCGQESHRRKRVALTINKSLKYSTWVQSQKWQTNLSSFPRQAIQHQSNPSLCPYHRCWRRWSWSVLWRPRRPLRTNT